MKLLGPIPREPFVIACSGGVDSMVLVDLLMRWRKNKISLAFFHHNTPDCDRAYPFVKKFAHDHNLEFHSGKISKEKEKGKSTEEYWRDERYAYLSTFNCPVLTAHHLQDVIETWIYTSIRYVAPSIIPYRRDNVIRPLLLVSKSEIMEWANRNHIQYIEDQSNNDDKHMRNYIRRMMTIPVMVINPGIEKMIRKKIIHKNQDLFQNQQ